MCFLFVLSGKTYPSEDVFLVGDRLHMVWINARTNPAKVVDNKPFWYRAFVQFVKESVSQITTVVKKDFPVSIISAKCFRP